MSYDTIYPNRIDGPDRSQDKVTRRLAFDQGKATYEKMSPNGVFEGGGPVVNLRDYALAHNPYPAGRWGRAWYVGFMTKATKGHYDQPLN